MDTVQLEASERKDRLKDGFSEQQRLIMRAKMATPSEGMVTDADKPMNYGNWARHYGGSSHGRPGTFGWAYAKCRSYGLSRPAAAGVAIRFLLRGDSGYVISRDGERHRFRRHKN